MGTSSIKEEDLRRREEKKVRLSDGDGKAGVTVLYRYGGC